MLEARAEADKRPREQARGARDSGHGMDPRTWPTDWEAQGARAGFGKCEQGCPDEDEWGVRWFAGAYLQRLCPQAGYTVVVFRGRHVPDPGLFTDEEVLGYWGEIRTVAAALYAVSRPAQLNYESMNNSVAHVHTHVMPQYVDDPAPGSIVPDEVFAEAPRLSAAELARQVQVLRAAH